jgi:predicted nucleotidyltransferase
MNNHDPASGRLKDTLESCRRFSESKVNEIRNALASLSVPSSTVIATYGSYARREASDQSDIDYVILTGDDEPDFPAEMVETIKAKINNVVRIDPSVDGPFAKAVPLTTLVSNLGGDADDNQNITRRMLLLLEGEWLTNEEGFRNIRRNLIENYVCATPKDHQIALFLLNDVIRYWRTMTVDYAYKTSETAVPKPWAIRNIKLVFSRKLMYAGGLFAVGMTADRTKSSKIECLERLFDMPVTERIFSICGRQQAAKAIEIYTSFLARMADAEFRDHLKSLGHQDREDSKFRELKNEAHHFTRELLALFEGTFQSTHPIRRAVIM